MGRMDFTVVTKNDYKWKIVPWYPRIFPYEIDTIEHRQSKDGGDWWVPTITSLLPTQPTTNYNLWEHSTN